MQEAKRVSGGIKHGLGNKERESFSARKAGVGSAEKNDVWKIDDKGSDRHSTAPSK